MARRAIREHFRTSGAPYIILIIYLLCIYYVLTALCAIRAPFHTSRAPYIVLII
jgi:hypothetical protein